MSSDYLQTSLGPLRNGKELSVNFFGSVAPEGHHLEPRHGSAWDRLLQDQQEVNFGAGGTQKNPPQNSTAESHVTKMGEFTEKLRLLDTSSRTVFDMS